MSEKTHAEIIEEMNSGPIPEHRHDREILCLYAYELDAAHNREVDALKQRCAELDAEVSAKDEVIKRLNAEVRKEQEERELRIAAQKAKAAAEGYADGKRDAASNNAPVQSVPFNYAALREALDESRRIASSPAGCRLNDYWKLEEIVRVCDAALAAPARNCDKVKDHSDAIEKFEKWMDFSPKTADEQDAFFKEHWFEFAMWLIDMNGSEAAK
jgi:hypothetical protein